MKYLLFSDAHLGIHGSSEVWLQATQRLFEEIIETCKQESIEKILFLGDFFNDRRSLNLRALWAAVDLADLIEASGLELYLILGNHDTYLKNSLEPHSLKIFNKYKHIHVIEEVTQLNEFITLVPWSLPWKTSETPYIFGHFEINGFDIESGDDNVFENNVSDFKRYTQVYSGHFHNPKKIRNVYYIGSCMPFTFHDVDSPRGYYILEIEDEKKADLQFIEFTKSPKYKIILSNKEFTEQDIKGNVIKVVYVSELSTIENEALISRINEFKPVMLQLDFKSMTANEERVEQDDADITKVRGALDLLNEFVDKSTFPNFINRDTMKAMVRQLIKEVD